MRGPAPSAYEALAGPASTVPFVPPPQAPLYIGRKRTFRKPPLREPLGERTPPISGTGEKFGGRYGLGPRRWAPPKPTGDRSRFSRSSCTSRGPNTTWTPSPNRGPRSCGFSITGIRRALPDRPTHKRRPPIWCRRTLRVAITLQEELAKFRGHFAVAEELLDEVCPAHRGIVASKPQSILGMIGFASFEHAPVDRVQGRQRRIKRACRARRSAVHALDVPTALYRVRFGPQV